MSQDLASAQNKSAQVLNLISQKTLSPEDKNQVIKDSIKYWVDHVNKCLPTLEMLI
jgi:hypothetical protein